MNCPYSASSNRLLIKSTIAFNASASSAPLQLISSEVPTGAANSMSDIMLLPSTALLSLVTAIFDANLAQVLENFDAALACSPSLLISSILIVSIINVSLPVHDDEPVRFQTYPKNIFARLR